MADFHILRSSKSGDSVQVAFHVDVPAENNSAGKLLSECIVEDMAPTSECDWLSQAELDEVTAGTVFEYLENVKMSGHLTNVQRLAIVQARAAVLIPQTITRIQARYRFWGYDGSIA